MTVNTGRKSIREILETEGIAWKSGYMHCPACGRDKVTASERINFAQCWACGRKWHPSYRKTTPTPSWAAAFLSRTVDPLRETLVVGSPAHRWLTAKRKLPSDIDWLRQHDLGVIPASTPFLSAAKESARKKFTLAKEEALANVKDEDDADTFESRWKAEHEQMEMTFEKADTLFRGSWAGALVFVYRNAHNEPISLNVRDVEKEGEGDRRIFRLQPLPGRRGVFSARLYPGDYWDNDCPNIVEGEINWLQACAFSDRWGREARDKLPQPIPAFAWLQDEERLKFKLPGMAVGGKNGADLSTIKSLCLNHGVPPTILYDNDAIDEDGKPGGYALVRSVNRLMPVYATTTPTKDLDDFLKDRNPSPADLKKLLDNADYLPRPTEAIREEVDKITYAPKLSKKVKTDQVADLILSDMLERGRFFNVGGMAVFLWEDESRVIEISQGHETWREFLLQYNIKPGEELCDDISLYLGAKCSDPNFAPRNKLRVLSLYDERTRCLYINEYAGTVVKIDGRTGQITRVPNGTDDVLFRAHQTAGGRDADHLPVTAFRVDIEKAQKSRSGLKLEIGSFLDQHILSSIRYSQESSVSEATIKQLLKAQILTMLMPDLFHTKAMPVFEGVGGAGKTTMGMFVGKLLVGQKFAPTKMPDDPDTLALLFTSKAFLVLDEWNQTNKKVEEKFRALSTGEWDTRREYYTTRKMVDTEPQAHAWLSANTMGAKKEATSRRLIIVDVDPRQVRPEDAVFRSVRALTNDFMAVRNDIWTELVGCLKNVIVAFHSLPEQPTSFSMADFGAFFITVAKAEGWETLASRMLLEMQARQIEQSAKNLEVVSLLSEFLGNSPSYEGKFYSAKEWAKFLLPLIPENDVELRRKLTANYLSWAFKSSETTLKEVFGMTTQKESHRKTLLYAFFLAAGNNQVPDPQPEIVLDLDDEPQAMQMESGK